MAKAALVNVTIDDTQGAPVLGTKIDYFPLNAWQSAPCPNCTQQSGLEGSSNGTWHYSYYGQGLAHGKASVAFNGTAVYLYTVLQGLTDSRGVRPDMTFLLDGKEMAGMDLEPPTGSGFAYDVLAFKVEGLHPMTHTLEVTNGLKSSSSMLYVDYVVYTTDESTLIVPTSGDSALSPLSMNNASAAMTSSHNSTTTALAVLLALALTSLLALSTLFLCRRYRRKQTVEFTHHRVQPFVNSSGHSEVYRLSDPERGSRHQLSIDDSPVVFEITRPMASRHNSDRPSIPSPLRFRPSNVASPDLKDPRDFLSPAATTAALPTALPSAAGGYGVSDKAYEAARKAQAKLDSHGRKSKKSGRSKPSHGEPKTSKKAAERASNASAWASAGHESSPPVAPEVTALNLGVSGSAYITPASFPTYSKPATRRPLPVPDPSAPRPQRPKLRIITPGSITAQPEDKRALPPKPESRTTSENAMRKTTPRGSLMVINQG